jgi:cell division septation protein DedD
MKSKAANKKVKKVKKGPIQYTLDFDVKGLMFFIFLSALTALVVFYLGWVAGKGSRNPNITGPRMTEEIIAERPAEKVITANDLEIYNIREDDRISNLKDNTKTILKEADRVLGESQQPAKKSAPTAKPKPAAPATPVKSWPDKPTKVTSQQEIYTVQVFATKDKEKAERIVRLLKEKEFEAYLTTATIEKQIIFRVRVGRKSKTEIVKLNTALKKVIGGMGMKSRVIKIN